ncbi:MAG: tryptophan-rich sensory protein, partial [Rhizobacter sp.]
MTRWKPVVVAAAAAISVAVLGALMTDLGPWYANLKQPPWKPPDWAFGPVWTTIFALAAAAG